MSDNFHKFLFLGVMIVLVVFANHGTVAEQQALSLSYGVNKQEISGKSVPTFVLQPIGALASNDLTGDISAKGIAESSSPSYAPAPSVPAPSSENGLFSSSGNSNQAVFSKISDGLAPDVQARIALVADLRVGTRYMQFDPSVNWPLASITKLMSAVIAYQKLGMSATATVTPEEFAADNTDQILKAGDAYAISDLLRVMLLPSSNVAAEAIAGAYGRKGFVAAMNDQAEAWGMRNTHFDDPSGISVGNRSTAADAFILAQQVYENYPRIFAITRTPQVYVKELSSGKRVTVKSINNFAGQADFVGGKTGHTDEASGNLLSLFSYNGKTVVIIVMGTEDRFGDTTKLLDWFKKNYK